MLKVKSNIYGIQCKACHYTLNTLYIYIYITKIPVFIWKHERVSIKVLYLKSLPKINDVNSTNTQRNTEWIFANAISDLYFFYSNLLVYIYFLMYNNLKIILRMRKFWIDIVVHIYYFLETFFENDVNDIQLDKTLNSKAIWSTLCFAVLF